jgi:hypothetical protein
MKTMLTAILTFLMLGCDSPAGPIDMGPGKLHKGKPFATINAVQTAFLTVVTTPMNDFYGDPITPLSVRPINNDQIYFTLSVANLTETENFWTGAYPDPDVYTNTVPIYLKGFIRAEILNESGQVMASIEPELKDVSETVPVLDPSVFRHHESSTFDGYWISAGWASLVSDVNGGDGSGGTDPKLYFPVSLVDGNYTLHVTLDPNNRWGQNTEVSVPFTLGAGAVTAAPFKSHGK